MDKEESCFGAIYSLNWVFSFLAMLARNGNVGQFGLSTTLFQTEIPQTTLKQLKQLLAEPPWNFAKTFIVPRGRILMTLVILWLLL